MGVSKLIESKSAPSKKQGYLVADMITGYGVAEICKHSINCIKMKR